MSIDSRTPSDRELTVAARAGDGDAWTELRRRHETAVRRFARGAGVGERHVDEVFADVAVALGADEAHGTPMPVLRAVRLRLLHAVAGVDSGPAAASDPTLRTIATAFGQLPEDWQAVLWHRCVDRSPAVEATLMLGRSTAGVLALEQTATRGLFDQAMLVELHGDPPLAPMCRPVVATLGAYHRGTLPPAESRAIEEHLHGAEGAVSAGCAECRARLDVAGRIPDLVAPAIVPWVTGRSPSDYRAAAALAAAGGVAALTARRTASERRRAVLLATAAVVLAIVAAAVLIRSPFRSMGPGLADLLDRAVATTVAEPATSTTTVPPGPVDGEPNRVELVFPDTPRGAVYVPGGRALNLTVSLSTPAPVFAGGTGTVDAGLMNNDSVVADVTFYVRTSEGVAFDEHADGSGRCRAEDDHGATCSVSIDPGGTAWMSLRFTVARDVPDRFVVDPGLDRAVLDVPVEFLSDLVIGTVERGDLTNVDGEFVVQRDPTAVRRLFVVTEPDVVIDASTPFESSIPVLGSDLPTTPRRLGRVDTAALPEGADDASTLSVAGVVVGGDDPFGVAAEQTALALRSYDLDIDSSTAAVQIVASTTTSGPRVTSLALVLDIVP